MYDTNKDKNAIYISWMQVSLHFDAGDLAGAEDVPAVGSFCLRAELAEKFGTHSSSQMR